MPDINHQFPIDAPPEKVFEAVSSPTGLDAWWTLKCDGRPEQGSEYLLYFDPEYEWRSVVSRYMPDNEFELEITEAQEDWLGSRVTFVLERKNDKTEVRFSHTGWPEANDHYKISSFCWAMYLRLLKRYIEFGEIVPYEKRLDA